MTSPTTDPVRTAGDGESLREIKYLRAVIDTLRQELVTERRLVKGFEAEAASLRRQLQEGQKAVEAMREAAKIACLDLNDAYREASESHMRAQNTTKAREAMDWAIGALECAHAVAKLSPETQEAPDA